MYLRILTKEQKELFLELAVNMISADGIVSLEEQATIEEYCTEMQIVYDENIKVRGLDEILLNLKECCDMKTRKIILFESLGLALVDLDYADSEKKMIKEMLDMFEIENGFDIKCEMYIQEYIDLQTRINKTVIGE